MKINKLKAISIAVCCLIVALCSGAQSMDTHRDIEEKISSKTNNKQQSGLSEVGSLNFESTSSHVTILKDITESFGSHLMTNVKTVIQHSSDIISFVANKPYLSAVIGLMYAAQFTAVAAQNCDGCIKCTCVLKLPGGSGCYAYGIASGVGECAYAANQTRAQFCSCK